MDLKENPTSSVKCYLIVELETQVFCFYLIQVSDVSWYYQNFFQKIIKIQHILNLLFNILINTETKYNFTRIFTLISPLAVPNRICCGESTKQAAVISSLMLIICE